MKRIFKNKKTTAFLLIIMIILGLVACGQKEEPQEQQPQEEEPQVTAHADSLVIALESEPTTLNPYDHAAVTSGYMNQLTYNKLFKLDVETLQPVPDLCESFENLDENTWTFTVKSGVKFHDGTTLTAEDVKASMEFARNFTSSNKYTSFWQTLEVVDDLTIKLTTDGPYALILNDLATNGNTIVPKHLIDSGNDFNENPIGTGPYKFIQWTLGDNLTFVKNEDYFDPDHAPSITNITWRIIPEGSSRTIALETGEVDMVVDVESTDVDRLVKDEGITLLQREGTRMNFMPMNNEKAPFDNELVRKAITCLVDKEGVAQVAANGQGEPSISLTPMAYMGASDVNGEKHDGERAKKLFEEAGVDPSTLTISCMAYTDQTRRTAEVVQNCLKEVGITVNIESLDFAAFLSKMLEGDYEMAIAGYSSSDVLTYLKGMYHTTSINAANSPRISDPEIDALIDLASTQLDEEERTATITQVTELINDRAPMVPLFISSVTRAYNSQLQGVKVAASGLLYIQDLSWPEAK